MTPNHNQQPENRDPPVLDLCTRKRPLTPEYYIDPKRIKTPPCAVSPQSVFSDSSEVSSTDINSNCTKLKSVRPFKAYPKDPLSMALIGTTTDILNKDSSEAYIEFRNRMMSQVQNAQGTNKNMRRTQSSKHIADPSYWEKRKKNNEAAKRSRDARRAKEDEIAIRCAFLEQENVQLKYRLAAAEAERKRLYDMVYH
ncbi:protein giant-like [Anoplophora glabripennis]|uniref:protein giant-like n=1 Tax=Anoplophora glabripennis TaxID=217634 RepID=UPI000C7920A6|nr:protein giant-like [Anoplophora glabripennis]